MLHPPNSISTRRRSRKKLKTEDEDDDEDDYEKFARALRMGLREYLVEEKVNNYSGH